MLHVCIVDEVADGLEVAVRRVENDLVIAVEPLKVDDADVLQLSCYGYLTSSTVDDGGDFVSNEEVKLVGWLAIPNKQAVFDFEGEVDGDLTVGPWNHHL